MATGTTTKRTKGDDIYPPAEIRDNTKARRAWVDAKIAELSADPSIASAKSVGIGSYQHVSVWHAVAVTGRERFRGVCQYCGHSQVVEYPGTSGARVVMHGYKRPGDGYLLGRCPGANHKPLNVERGYTCDWHDAFTLEVPRKLAALEAAQLAEAEALTTLTLSGEDRWTASHAEPRKPDASKIRRNPAAVAEFDTAWNNWSKAWPIYNAWRVRVQEHADARHGYRYAQMMEKHFADLLAGPAFGSPLEREIVA